MHTFTEKAGAAMVDAKSQRSFQLGELSFEPASMQTEVKDACPLVSLHSNAKGQQVADDINVGPCLAGSERIKFIVLLEDWALLT